MNAGLTRRERWAAFSVRANRDLRALATDVLLYDRLILPIPADDAEYHRFVKEGWDPEDATLRVIQSADHIIAVPWTDDLRQEWRNRWSQLQHLSSEAAYGLTSIVYAYHQPAWDVINTGLPETVTPERRPFIVAGFQSDEEAQAAFSLAPAKDLDLRDAEAAEQSGLPGARPIDRSVGLRVQRIVYEPAEGDPEEMFLAAVKLAENPRFLAARRSLFDLEDALVTDHWSPQDVEVKLDGLEEEYRDAVRAFTRQTRQRRATTLLPQAAGLAVAAAGQPHASGAVRSSLTFVVGRFNRQLSAADPSDDPGAALAMIRAAYRSQDAESNGEARRRWWRS